MAELQNAPWSEWDTVRLIGRGSFGSVYEIQRKLVDEDIESAALKVITIPQNPGDVEELYSEGYDDESITATFNTRLKSIVAEYSLMRKMNGSSNIVSCDDIRYVQHDDGIGWDIYIRMELLTPLMKALPINIPEGTVIQIGKDICNALILCKKYDIVHRDIKPQNILVSPNGDYKLGDFGIAKTMEKTMGGTKIGTYKYMAPEVYNNQPYGSAADIYSLGMVLYWMLNERRMPFLPLPPVKLETGLDEEARNRRLSGERLPAPAHGCDELKRIVLKACAYEPKDRFASAAEMLDALNKLSGSAAVASAGAVGADQDDDLTDGPDFSSKKTGTSSRKAPDGEKTVPVQKKKQGDTSKATGNRLTGIAIGACVVLALIMIGCFSVHIWTEATCTEASVCKICGKTRGEALGHRWDKATCIEPRTCSVCGETEGFSLGHVWTNATCSKPKTCSFCGTTEGKALSHQWIEATCTSAKTCAVCGVSEGTPLEHNWTGGTCAEPSRCSVCGATGDVPGHVWSAEGTGEIKVCSVCGMVDCPSGFTVEKQVLVIREIYNGIIEMQSSGELQITQPCRGVHIYTDSNEAVRILVVYRGTDGIGDASNSYRRNYYFSNGELVFAFYEGEDSSHRFYFYGGRLVRWRYTLSGNKVDHNLEFSEEYLNWEKTVYAECNARLEP